MLDNDQKIPKIIHYCWFGKKPLPKLVQKCMQSWKIYCPDYQLIRWDEHNFDVNSNLYVKQAYEARKYAFVSDYVRLWALYNYGGIYLDTDVEVLRNLDRFLSHRAFIGFQSTHKLDSRLLSLNTALIGAEKGNKLIYALLNLYDSLSFVHNGVYDFTTNNTRVLEYMKKIYNLKLVDAFQDLGDIAIYPSEYFSPSNVYFKKLTTNTYAIHYYTATWFSFKQKCRKTISIIGIRILGFERYNKIKNKLGFRNYFNYYK